MAFQQVEFEFPDPDKKGKDDFEVEIEAVEEAPEEIVVEPAVNEKVMGAPEKEETDEVEIEVIDDTPKADRGRKPSPPPDEVTDEELENYSEKVSKRINQFSKGYHDERRAKEQALRDREELARYVKAVVEENNNLKTRSTQSQNALLTQAKKQVETEVAEAKRLYKEAYEAGDADKLVDAQEALTTARLRVERVANMKAPTPEPLQQPRNEVQVPVPTQEDPAKDTKAEAWREENSWFGADDEMTAFALGVHKKLVSQGVDPQSDEYYEAINARMQTVFSEELSPEEHQKIQKSGNVVAPATRSRASNKVTLTKTQMALTKKLGVTPQEYARQVALLRGKQNG